MTLVINITDVNDKIYDAARARGIGSGELAREMTARYLADTERARSRPPRPRAAGLGDDGGRSSRTSTLIGAQRTPTRPTATSTSACARTATTAASRTAARGHGPGRGAGGLRAQARPAGLRAVEGAKEGEDTCGTRPGDPAPRLAHRVLGDGRGVCSASASTSTAAARTSSFPTTRTRPPRPVRPAARSWRGCGCTTG